MVSDQVGQSTSISLVHRARALEPDAWNMLTRLYGPLIYSWARKSGLKSEDAADVLQNVFVSVWRGLPAFKADRPESSFRGWLRVITGNAVRDWARRGETLILAQAAMERVADPENSADADFGMAEGADDLFSNLTNRALTLVRSTVDERTWSAFWKSTMDDIPVAEIAMQLELSPAAVRQAKYRVLCRLRELLADR